MTSPKTEVGGAPYGAVIDNTPASLFGTLTGLFKSAVTECIRHRSFRAAEKELHSLDDRMLRDIGITRSEISSALVDAAHERRNGRRPPLI
jgi:uncharacterized protein YjiS (DUF1127 family)